MNFYSTISHLRSSSSSAFASSAWDPKTQEPYDLTLHDSNGSLQDFQPLHPGFDDFKGFTAQEIIEVTDNFLFSCEEDDEITALMTAPLMDETFVTPTKPPATKSGYYPPTEAIHSVSPSPSKEASPKRRHRDCDRVDSPKRFRSYQSGNWAQRFKELCAYRQEHGDCLISHTYSKNLPLARWVKRQRYQYKLMISGQPSTMIPERVRALEEIGFCWGSQESAWSERFEELLEFKARVGHCNVPSMWKENPRLSTWIKAQRRQFKLFKNESNSSNISLQRILKLEALGFEWELKNSKKVLTPKKH